MDLQALFRNLAPGRDDNLLVGMETADDAAVYRVSADTAIVHTADFIAPLTNDPHVYGQIAAANSLSDVYAMGGRPVMAINLCCFPAKGPSMETLAGILKGGHLDRNRLHDGLLICSRAVTKMTHSAHSDPQTVGRGPLRDGDDFADHRCWPAFSQIINRMALNMLNFHVE